MKLLLNSKQEKKMIGHHNRLRAPAIKKKTSFLICTRYSRVKLCAVRMRNAILRNDLKRAVSAYGRVWDRDVLSAFRGVRHALQRGALREQRIADIQSLFLATFSSIILNVARESV